MICQTVIFKRFKRQLRGLIIKDNIPLLMGMMSLDMFGETKTWATYFVHPNLATRTSLPLGGLRSPSDLIMTAQLFFLSGPSHYSALLL